MADITFTQTATASVPTPATGKSAFYFCTTDGAPHYVDSSGTDHTISGGGSGTVTSVALSLPAVFVVSGSPVTTSGTLSATLAAQTTNTVLAGPTSGTAASPTFRVLTGADLPVMGASGSTHAPGAVPDPGSTAGTTRYLREDATWDVPPGGSGSPSGSAGGDLSGTYPNPTVAAIQGRPILNVAPSNGQVITWDATNNLWSPETPASDYGLKPGTLSPDTYGDVAWDLSQAQFATLTLTQNCTLDNPTNLAAGFYVLLVEQNSTGGWSLAFGNATPNPFVWLGGTPTLNTTDGTTTMILFGCDGTNMYGWVSPAS